MLSKIKAKVRALLASPKVRAQAARLVRLFALALAADPVASALIHGRGVTWVAIEGTIVGAGEVVFRQVRPGLVADLETAVAKALASKPAAK